MCIYLKVNLNIVADLLEHILMLVYIKIGLYATGNSVIYVHRQPKNTKQFQ